jgi:acyl carrier protein
MPDAGGPSVEDEVRAILAGLVTGPAAGLSLDVRLESCGVDSLTMVDVTVSLEERFGIAFPPDGTPADHAIHTLRDLVRCVEDRIAESRKECR